MSSFLKNALLCTTLLFGPAASFAQEPDPSLIDHIAIATTRGFDNVKSFNLMPSIAFNLKSQKGGELFENAQTLSISNEAQLPGSVEFSVTKQAKRHGGPHRKIPREAYTMGFGLQQEGVIKTTVLKTGEEQVREYSRGGVYGFFIATPFELPFQPRHSPFLGSVRVHTGVLAGTDSRNSTLAALANVRFSVGYKLGDNAILGLSATAGGAYIRDRENTEVAKVTTNSVKPYTTANLVFQIALK